MYFDSFVDFSFPIFLQRELVLPLHCKEEDTDQFLTAFRMDTFLFIV